MSKNYLDVVVIGAGPAGLSLSYFLNKFNLQYIVLEKSQICSQWLNRFENFQMNTANWMNRLPGAAGLFEDKNHLQQVPNQLATGEQVLAYLQQYAAAVNPPIQAPCEVTSLDYLGDDSWHVMTSRGPLHCRHVVVCTGSAALPKWSALALSMREKIPSLYANTYRHPRQIKTRRVLVVGSGSSGTQICEDLARSRQFDEIILSVSGNRRFSWKVLGIPIHSIVKHLGLFDLAADAWLGRWIIRLAGNHGDPATPPAPATLASQYGVRCVQKIQAFDGESIISKNGQRISTHDLTIIWCTGFRPDFTLLPESVQEVIARLPGWPIASHGRVPGFPGLHVLGQRFQSTLSSHILYGMTRDAARIARRIQAEMR